LATKGAGVRGAYVEKLKEKRKRGKHGGAQTNRGGKSLRERQSLAVQEGGQILFRRCVRLKKKRVGDGIPTRGGSSEGVL